MFRTLIAAPLALALAACAHDAHHPDGQAEAHHHKMGGAHHPVNLVLLYTLKDGVTPADFEAWVRSTDYPSMRGLKRVADFRTHRAERLLMGDGKPTVQYIEMFSIPDLDGFVANDMGGPTVQSVMGQFMGFASAPQFIVVSEIK